MHADEVPVDEELVGSLLRSQCPELAGLPMQRVVPWGTDHAVFRLGEELVVRLPRIGWANGQPAFEARWLPFLAPHLPVLLPEPVLLGQPSAGYPFEWAVHRWVHGEPAGPSTIGDPVAFALELADVVRPLQRVPLDDSPPATNRARPLQDYEQEALGFIAYAGDLIDAEAARTVWAEAVAVRPHAGPPVWVQGDLEGNCIVDGGTLVGIVDWGSACAGDPAVDVQVVWSPLFTDASRTAFLDALGVDQDTLARSRGAAVHQACAALRYYQHTYPLIVERSRHKLEAIGVAVR
jgi:aminoglycoside phosphotransferase (APT) family kinase protein